jgi:hypothetical protein
MKNVEFTARSPLNKPNVVEVRYNCVCGCKPRARYERDTDEAGHEHCCCGRVHFVGEHAADHLQAYLAERRTTGEDLRTYDVDEYQVQAPWGAPIPVAFGTPDVITGDH